MLVYNAIRGNYPTSTEGFYEIVFPYMFVSSPEDYEAYAKYFTGTELPYYPDEIAAIADYTFEQLSETCAQLSVEDVVKRHAQ
jgi:ribose transport system substrate-binding protein